jgi:carbamoyltransferase
LGNRSILFDPTFEDGKEFVNQVKRREYFRPFAATVLAEHADEWFDLRGMKESPSMMYAVNCREGVEKKVPSVIHVDNTCRIQTVTKEQNEHFYNLISAFNKEKNVPMLFNTSFNLGGDPLVETLQDAINTLKNSQIEYLYLPEYGKLIVIKNMFKLSY